MFTGLLLADEQQMEMSRMRHEEGLRVLAVATLQQSSWTPAPGNSTDVFLFGVLWRVCCSAMIERIRNHQWKT